MQGECSRVNYKAKLRAEIIKSSIYKAFRVNLVMHAGSFQLSIEPPRSICEVEGMARIVIKKPFSTLLARCCRAQWCKVAESFI